MGGILEVGKMYRPSGIVSKINDDAVYVVEQYNHRVSKWTYNPGTFDPFILDASWGSNGDGTSGVPGKPIADDDDRLQFPTGIVRDAATDKLFVSDTLNHRIRVIDDITGDFEDSIGEAGTGDGQLYRPIHMDNNVNGTQLAIADSRNHRVAIFNNTDPFAFVDIVEQPPENFHTPWGVKHNAGTNNFFYSDVIKGQIFRYSSDGETHQLTFGEPGTDPTDPNQLFYPSSSIGPPDNPDESFLVDTRNNKIKIYDENGNISDFFGTAGTGDGQLYWPEHATGFLDITDYLCVCNTLNNRVEVYDRSTGIFQVNFGSP